MTALDPKQYTREQVLDTAAAALYAGLAVSTIRGAINQGKLPAWKPDGAKVWLVLKDDIDEWRKTK